MNAGSLFASMMVSAVGFGFLAYGRKQARIPQVVVGLALMLYPYLVDGVGAMLVIGGALLVALWLSLRMGM